VLAKTKIVYEGEEPKKFLNTIRGKVSEEEEGAQSSGSEEDDSEEVSEEEEENSEEGGILKYESPFIKRINLPQEPRLFCLIYNGSAVEYESEAAQDDEEGARKTAETDSIIFKEIHSFT
jgi:hypothetical protein